MASQYHFRVSCAQWEPVPYFNNQIICELVEAKHRGIISLLVRTQCSYSATHNKTELLMAAVLYRTRNVCSPERPRTSPSWPRWRKRLAVTHISSRRLDSWDHCTTQRTNVEKWKKKNKNKNDLILIEGINSQTKRQGRHWKGENSACCTMLERLHTQLLVR